jgi:hypothetical protein
VAWRWRYDGGAGAELSAEFPTQGDAEAWLGDHWSGLRAEGVSAVTLLEDDRAVYGPMSLDPA